MEKIKKLIIFGNGKFADFIAYSFNTESSYEISAFCVEKKFLLTTENAEFGVPIISFEEIGNLYPPHEYHIFIAVGNDALRERIYNECKNKKYFLPNFISPFTIIPKNLKLIGENIFIGEGSNIQPFVTIESNTYIIGARIGHHCLIKKNSLLSACLLGAEVEIYENSFIGLNSTVRPKIRIAKNNIIGMGAIINKHTKDFEVYSASSARKRTLTYKEISDSFL